jgi:hypothetical protein
MTDRNLNKESKLRLIVTAVTIRSKLCLYINLYKYYRQVCFFFIWNLYQHLMYTLELKTVDKVVYRRENSSVQAKIGHDDLAKIRFDPVRSEPVPALSQSSVQFLLFDDKIYA